MNKYDKSILLTMIAADSKANLTSYSKEKSNTFIQTIYHQKINIIKLIKQKIDDHNLVSDNYWDINLINFNTSEWVLNKLLSKIDEGVFTELFSDGRLSFY